MLNLLIYINRNKLEKMIKKGNRYEEILKQSEKLDKYIFKKLIKINKRII